MDTKKTAKVISQLDALSKRDLSIVRVSEPITSAVSQSETAATNSAAGARTSDVSTSSLDAPTPASLEADLAHYKELFAKLRFSYVEQVTKEKFIRAIVGDPPLIVDPSENVELEAGNAAAKAELKALKQEVASLIADLETRAIDVARRHARVEVERARLRELPSRISGLETSIAELKARAAADGDGAGEGDGDGDDGEKARRAPEMRLPLARTPALVDQRKAEMRELDRTLEQLKGAAPRKRKEMERLQAELQPLEVKRQNCAAAAKEARRRKEAAALGAGGDDLEERGRWWRNSEAVLTQMLDIKG